MDSGPDQGPKGYVRADRPESRPRGSGHPGDPCPPPTGRPGQPGRSPSARPPVWLSGLPSFFEHSTLFSERRCWADVKATADGGRGAAGEATPPLQSAAETRGRGRALCPGHPAGWGSGRTTIPDSLPPSLPHWASSMAAGLLGSRRLTRSWEPGVRPPALSVLPTSSVPRDQASFFAKRLLT